MSRVLLTGAHGYLGARIDAALRIRGFEVRRLVRRPRGEDELAFTLGEAPAAAFDEVIAFVHCAHDFAARGEAARSANVDGSIRLFEAARAAGVQRRVFVSSVSACEGAPSEYGRGKLAVERFVAELGGVSVRPGLLFGCGGGPTFAKLQRAARLPLLPVFDGGRHPLYLAHVDDAATAVVEAMAFEAEPAPIVAAHPRPWPFAELLRELGRRQGRAPRLFSIPSALALGGLRALERIGATPPFRSDSLLALLNPPMDLDFEGARRLGLVFRDFADE